MMINTRGDRDETLLRKGDAVISYLPYPHAFEQIIFTLSLHIGMKIGYYQGNNMKLIEDC